MITPQVVNHKAYTPALLLTREMLVPTLSNVSVNVSISVVWKATRALIWTLASNMLGSGRWCARHLSLTNRPLRLPLLRRPRCFGSASEIRSHVQGEGQMGR